MAAFNSDDLIFSDAQQSSPSRAHIGKKSIQRVFEDAAADRAISKKVVKRLKFSHGGLSPGVRMEQTLWVRRFESLRQAWGQDANEPYSGDDLIRFFVAIIPKMSISANKTGPQKSTITRGLTILLAYGHFKWNGFKMGAHESGRFKVFLDKAVREGTIMTGSWQKKTWLGFAVLSRLVSTFLSRAIKQGTYNWDITITKCLSVVLVSSLGARSGDVARSQLYKGQEYLQYRHIEMYIVGAQPTIANLRATVTLEYQKGHKNANNEETQHYFTPLEGDAQNSHMCPIAWLLVHALRHSLVGGQSLQDVLDRAFARSDRQVEWLYPSHPVLAAIDTRRSPHIDLERPAMVTQLLRTIKEMGVVSGMLDRAYMHAIRLGFARDIAQLPASNKNVGFNPEPVRQSLGHTAATTHRGVTDKYIGDPHTEFHSLRAQQSREPKGKVPRFATPAGVESRAMTAQKLKNDSTTPLPEISGRRPLASMDSNTPITNSREPAVAHPLQNVDPALLTEDDVAEVVAAVATSAVDELCGMIFPESAKGVDAEPKKDNTNIPVLFSNANPQEVLDSLTDKSGVEEDEALFVNDGNPAPVYSSPEEFVAAYSRVNVVDNYTLGRAWHGSDNDVIAEAMGQYCMFGGSRDEPTPMLHACSKTPGCIFTDYSRLDIKRHESECSQDRMDRVATGISLLDTVAEYACPHEGCKYRPAPGSDLKSGLRAHLLAVHKFVPKPCEHGCDPETLHLTDAHYRRHIQKMHSSHYPRPCSFPGCTSTTEFGTMQHLKVHLQKVHKLQDFDEIDSYVPQPEPKRKYVAEQVCWMEDCEQTPKDEAKMVNHLMTKKHGMSKDDAKAAIQAHAEFETVVEQRKPAKKRAIPTRKLEKEQENAQKAPKTDN